MINNQELFQMYHLKEMSLSAELFLSCSVLQLTFYAISTAYNRKAGFVMLNQPIYYIGALLIGLTSLLLLNEDLLVNNAYISNNCIINDYLSFVTKLTICLISLLFLVIINISFRDEPIRYNFEYVVLIIISILGLLLLCSSNDLITAYLAIELQSVAFYIMAAFKKNSTYSIESGLKYFIIGSLSSAFFLFGSALLYGCLGSLNFDDFRMFSSLLFQEDKSSISMSTIPTVAYSSISLLAALKVLETPAVTEGCKVDWLHEVDKTVGQELMEFSYLLALETTAKYGITFNFPSVSTLIEDFGSTYGTLISSELIEHISSEDKELLRSTELSTSESVDIIISLIERNDQAKAFASANVFKYKPETLSVLNPSASLYYSSLLDINFFDSCINSNSYDLDSANFLLKSITTSFSQSVLSALPFSNLIAFDTSLIAIGFMFICISILIKLAVAPFHYWSLDVYEGSPNTTTVFFAVVPKIGLFVLLTRLCYNGFYSAFTDNYQIYFIILSVLSIFVGSLGGLEQRKIKTLFAYSSISHTGYLMLSFSTGSVEGIQMMFYYLVIYMISSLCFWSVYLFLIQKRHHYSNKNNKELGDFVLLKESNPMLCLILVMTLFSIAGIPPIVGFLAKIGVFLVVVKSSAYLVAVISILLSVISTFYYIRFIKILYFDNSMVGKLYVPISTQKSIVIAVLALSLILLCLDPSFIYLLFQKASLLTNY